MIGFALLITVLAAASIALGYEIRKRPSLPSMQRHQLGTLADIQPEETDEANRAALNELTREIRVLRGRVISYDNKTGVVEVCNCGHCEACDYDRATGNG